MSNFFFTLKERIAVEDDDALFQCVEKIAHSVLSIAHAAHAPHKLSPAPNNAGPRKAGILFAGSSCEASRDGPSCLAVYFTWPQVALTHHVCLPSLLRSEERRVGKE